MRQDSVESNESRKVSKSHWGGTTELEMAGTHSMFQGGPGLPWIHPAMYQSMVLGECMTLTSLEPEELPTADDIPWCSTCWRWSMTQLVILFWQLDWWRRSTNCWVSIFLAGWFNKSVNSMLVPFWKHFWDDFNVCFRYLSKINVIMHQSNNITHVGLLHKHVTAPESKGTITQWGESQ